ncbi:vacuolar ATPase assembly integral membrane protein vma21 [Blyttiomyces sp. JEL0837]|nr:vacuolar ATPase assembly integral membrane protein vma21 [Blyttiomyces sp. JEL0837]
MTTEVSTSASETTSKSTSSPALRQRKAKASATKDAKHATWDANANDNVNETDLKDAIAKEVETDAKVTTKRRAVARKANPPPVSNKTVVPPAVIAKLIFFSVLMFSLPIGMYFYTLNNVFDGNTTYSAISAVVVANMVLIAYVVMAFLEDKD